MYIDPYETTACRSHRLTEVYRAIGEALIEGALYNTADPDIYYVTENNSAVKPFAHPVIMDHPSEKNKRIVVADVRSATRFDRQSGELRGGPDFQYIKYRCLFMRHVWMDNNPLDLLHTGDIQVRLFAHLMGENIGRRMNLDPSTTTYLKIVSAYYYIGLFYFTIPREEMDRVGHAKRISRSLLIPIDQILAVIDVFEPMSGLPELCQQMATHASSPRLSKLNAGLIMTMLGGVWYGSNNVENVAVALEHPPTFCAMLYSVLNDNSYRKTILGQLALNLDKRQELSKPFVQNLGRLIDI